MFFKIYIFGTSMYYLTSSITYICTYTYMCLNMPSYLSNICTFLKGNIVHHSAVQEELYWSKNNFFFFARVEIEISTQLPTHTAGSASLHSISKWLQL